MQHRHNDKRQKAFSGDLSKHPSAELFSVMSLTAPHQEATSVLPRDEGWAVFRGCQSKPCQPLPPPSPGIGSHGSSSQGDSPAGLEAVAPCFQGFMSLHASRRLDNAHLCESLYSTVQEQYIVIQGLRHHNLVPWQQMSCHKGLRIPEGGGEGLIPGQSGGEWEIQDKGSGHCYL